MKQKSSVRILHVYETDSELSIVLQINIKREGEIDHDYETVFGSNKPDKATG